ncbi:hypothetical protein P9272_34855, partial [Mesorhizobium sp. WSM4976]|nr:hypothetical protein [Mesorhizobium sp. WSM4976]
TSFFAFPLSSSVKHLISVSTKPAAGQKALLDELRLHYLHAHQIASRIERDAARGAGLIWRHYQSVVKGHEKAIDEEQLRRVPGELDLTPHKDLKDYPFCDGWSKHRSSSLRGMVQGRDSGKLKQCTLPNFLALGTSRRTAGSPA